jgi:hypothetical protein
MADITGYNHGEVEDADQVNWRGDQVSVGQGGQSIYKSSSVKLTDLGSRKVVGDRVFRYAKCLTGLGAGDVGQDSLVSLINVTAGATNASGGKIFTFYFATSNGAGTYDDGFLIAQSGTAANLGYSYKVKTQPLVATTANADLTLYDPLARVNDVADKWSLFSNPYGRVSEMTNATNAAVGVAPIAVTTNDFFWLQTWGPCNVKAGAALVDGNAFVAGATGQIAAPTATTGGALGYVLQPTLTVSEYGYVFLTIAP